MVVDSGGAQEARREKPGTALRMRKELKEQWRRFGLLELEFSACKAFRQLFDRGHLQFISKELQARAKEEQLSFIEQETVPYFFNGVRQAREYFEHALESSLLIKPLLHYYGSMSLAKSLVLLGYPDFFIERGNVVHGISLPSPRKTAIDQAFDQILLRVDTRGIFPTAYKSLHGFELPGGLNISLSEVFTRLPDLVLDVRLILKAQPAFLELGKIVRPVSGISPGHFEIDATVSGEYADILRGAFRKNWEDDFTVGDYGERIQVKSKDRWGSMQNPILRLVLFEHFEFSLASDSAYIPKPFRSEPDEHLVPIREVELLYLMVFAFGSLARYHPTLWVELNSGRKNLLSVAINDAIDLFESRFLVLVDQQLERFDIPIV